MECEASSSCICRCASCSGWARYEVRDSGPGGGQCWGTDTHAHTPTSAHTCTHKSGLGEGGRGSSTPTEHSCVPIENLQKIEFGIFVRSPRFSIIQNKKYKKETSREPPPLPTSLTCTGASSTRAN